MTVAFRQSFERDVSTIKRNAQLRTRLRQTIERLESAEALSDVNATAMQGWDDYYRIRIGDYRLGLKLDGDEVILLRFLHRREIYRRFP